MDCCYKCKYGRHCLGSSEQPDEWLCRKGRDEIDEDGEEECPEFAVDPGVEIDYIYDCWRDGLVRVY